MIRHLLLLSGLVLLTTRPLASSAGAPPLPPWFYSLEQGQLAAKATGRLLLLYFTATWCPPCQRMDREVWPQPNVQEALRGLVPVKVDVFAHRELAWRYRIQAIPTIVIIEAGGELVARVEGYHSAGRLVKTIRPFAVNASAIYAMQAQLAASPGNPYSLYNLGKAYGHGAGQLQPDARKAFLLRSEMTLKGAAKACEPGRDDILREKIQLAQYGIDLIFGRTRSVIRGLEEELTGLNGVNRPEAYLILVQAYVEQGDEATAAAYLRALQALPGVKRQVARAEELLAESQ